MNSILICSLVLAACQPNQDMADLIVVNANIWTGNQVTPRAESFAVKGGRIAEIGTNRQINRWKGDQTEVFDAAGSFITPGFIDSHVHFLTGGMNLASVQLRNANTPEEFVRRIIDFSKTQPKGTWILGGDWDHEQWGGQLPERSWIDDHTHEHPVFVRRLDGHMALANSLALEIAGVTASSQEVEGGEIVRTHTGEPSGILRDNAMRLVQQVVPSPSRDALERALEAAMDYVAAQGVTSVHHVTGTEPPGYMDVFENARDSGKLKTRIYAMMPLREWKALLTKVQQDGNGDEWLKIGGLKGFVDGSLGSHTALFQQPYTDSPNDKGIFINNKDSLEQWIRDADEAGLHIAVHAIGDAAIHFLLDTYEKVIHEHGERDRRFRIEHAQHIDPADIARFGALNVIPSMQPYHLIDDGRWAQRLIGPERIKSTYAFKSLFDSGAKVALGSDWFVAPPTPLEGIYAAVTRRTLDDKNPDGWVPDQKITVEQALHGYTTNAAYASFDEGEKGSLEVGKLADFVILNEDITAIDPEQIWNVKVLQTYVGGKKVYHRK